MSQKGLMYTCSFVREKQQTLATVRTATVSPATFVLKITLHQVPTRLIARLTSFTAIPLSRHRPPLHRPRVPRRIRLLRLGPRVPRRRHCRHPRLESFARIDWH